MNHMCYQVQMSIPVEKCCMSDYVRKINHELAIFPQLRNLLRQFTNFSIKYLFKIMNSASDLIILHLVELLKKFQAARFAGHTSLAAIWLGEVR